MNKPLNTLKNGEIGKIISVNGQQKTRLLQMGFTKGTLVEVKRIAPFGGPMEIIIRSSNLIMRQEEANNILVKIEEDVI